MSDTEHPEQPANETGDQPESGTSGPTSRFFALVDDAEARRLPRGLLVLCFSLVVVVLVVFIFQQLGSILQPLFIAAFVGYLIMPIHRFLIQVRIPSVLAYGAMVLLILVLAFGFARILQNGVTALNSKMPTYTRKIDATINWCSSQIDGIHQLAKSLKLGGEKQPGEPGGADGAGAAPASATAQEPERGDAPAATPSVSRSMYSKGDLEAWLLAFAGGFSSFLISLVLVIVYLAFLLAESATIDRRVRRVFGGDQGGKVIEVIGAINQAISKYIAVLTGINAMIGVLTTVVLLIFGVDLAILWGLIAFLVSYIPYVGGVVGVFLPASLAYLQFGMGFRFVAVTVALLGIQQAVGYVIQPRLMGRHLDLSPLVVLLAVAFWAWLWPVIGMILAVPIVVSLKIILDHIPATKPIAGLMSNMPAEDV